MERSASKSGQINSVAVDVIPRAELWMTAAVDCWVGAMAVNHPGNFGQYAYSAPVRSVLPGRFLRWLSKFVEFGRDIYRGLGPPTGQWPAFHFEAC